MIQTINSYDFIDAFRKMERDEQFSREGLFALFDYYEELGTDTGGPIELDVIAICCEWSEYEGIADAYSQYILEDDEHYTDDIDKQREYFFVNTTIIELNNGNGHVLVREF